MNVVRLERGFRLDVAPGATSGFADLTAVEAVFAGAHDFPRSRGFAWDDPLSVFSCDQTRQVMRRLQRLATLN